MVKVNYICESHGVKSSNINPELCCCCWLFFRRTVGRPLIKLTSSLGSVVGVLNFLDLGALEARRCFLQHSPGTLSFVMVFVCCVGLEGFRVLKKQQGISQYDSELL